MLVFRQKYLIYLIGFGGGGLAGIGLSQGGVWFIYFSLALLWASKKSPLAGFLWGFSATLVSHFWLLSLHPLTWIGVSEILSLPIALLIWVACGCMGALLVWSWCLLGKLHFFDRAWESSLINQSLSMLALSLIWGFGEVLLAKGSFFWFGLGGSLLPNNLWLAGLARWFGAGGLATIQLVIGWWIFRVFLSFNKGNSLIRIFSVGFAGLLLAHLVGGYLLGQNDSFSSKRIALWQTNIPIRKKFSSESIEKAPLSLKESLSRASESGADLMVAPEGTLLSDQDLLSPAPIPLLSGGFRWVQNHQRSSLLVFEKGSIEYSDSIDKHRLVPLGEWIPSIPFLPSSGLSLVGGLESGEGSRLLNWSSSPLAVAICYEISDGKALAKATADGAQWILSIANLDPYPISLQRQFLALAQLRSIELGRELISVANTGPTALVLASGEIKSLVPPFQEGLGITDINLSQKFSGYVLWGEYPLIIILLVNLVLIINLRTID